MKETLTTIDKALPEGYLHLQLYEEQLFDLIRGLEDIRKVVLSSGKDESEAIIEMQSEMGKMTFEYLLPVRKLLHAQSSACEPAMSGSAGIRCAHI